MVYGKDGKEKTEAAVGDTVTVCVKGLGCYSGSTSVSYRYIEAGQNIAKLKAFKLKEKEFDGHAVTLTKADLTGIFYTGGKDNPEYLVPGEDFEVVSYTKNEKTGTAKVTIRGIGKWGGTKTLNFKIKAKKGEYKGALVDGEWK